MCEIFRLRFDERCPGLLQPGSILMTGLVNAHVVRTALPGRRHGHRRRPGKAAGPRSWTKPGQNRVPIIATGCSMFEACSRISESFLEGKR